MHFATTKILLGILILTPHIILGNEGNIWLHNYFSLFQHPLYVAVTHCF